MARDYHRTLPPTDDEIAAVWAYARERITFGELKERLGDGTKGAASTYSTVRRVLLRLVRHDELEPGLMLKDIETEWGEP